MCSESFYWVHDFIHCILVRREFGVTDGTVARIILWMDATDGTIARIIHWMDVTDGTVAKIILRLDITHIWHKKETMKMR